MSIELVSDRQQLARLIKATFMYYNGRAPEPEVLSMMCDDLAHLPFEKVAAAYAQYRRNPKNRMFPLPAQICELVNPEQFVSIEARAREIAARIVGAIPKYGWANAKEAQLFIGPEGIPAAPSRAPFFDYVRAKLGKLNQKQVDGFELLLAKFAEEKITDVRWCAYMLATTWHETARTMQPVTEYGSKKYLKSKVYWPYIGRGYVQLTWRKNYERYGIVTNPELALDPDMAAHILVDGMVNGIFTGKSLPDYFNAKVDDPIGARRIVNGTDKAKQIAAYYHVFTAALIASKPSVIVA